MASNRNRNRTSARAAAPAAPAAGIPVSPDAATLLLTMRQRRNVVEAEYQKHLANLNASSGALQAIDQMIASLQAMLPQQP